MSRLYCSILMLFKLSRGVLIACLYVDCKVHCNISNSMHQVPSDSDSRSAVQQITCLRSPSFIIVFTTSQRGNYPQPDESNPSAFKVSLILSSLLRQVITWSVPCRFSNQNFARISHVINIHKSKLAFRRLQLTYDGANWHFCYLHLVTKNLSW